FVVVDTPPVSASDPESVERVAALLDRVRPDEVHLVLAGGSSAEEVTALADRIGARIPFGRIMLTKLDENSRVGAGVGLAVATHRAVSYVMHGAGRLRPADALELADLVLQ